MPSQPTNKGEADMTFEAETHMISAPTIVLPAAKVQIPNSKFQTNPKFQPPNLRGGRVESFRVASGERKTDVFESCSLPHKCGVPEPGDPGARNAFASMPGQANRYA